MKYLSSAILSTVGVVAVSFSTGAANAASFSYGDLIISTGALSGAASINFANSTGWSGNYNLVTGSVVNQYANPLGNVGPYSATEPTGASIPGLNSGSATYTFSAPVSSFAFLWGSIDPGNSLTINYNDAPSDTITGALLASKLGLTADGSWTSPTSNAVLTFADDALDKAITSITFQSSTIAFEVAPVPVPVPAIVPGIALAAAFFGGKAIKRNKKANDSVA
ncbi:MULTISPECIES: hypothetical protein [Pseudanabaena]|uniref:PEP motif anchor domain protein n=2 Tax=Pseudanabaena TaxID=1152 RepID=L8MZC5_9CYAN|nr:MULTISPECIES: hypothetical protein [Pseudanabaena]ELS31835.1 hypothetical protein Pse7429DRAFT_3261 [Pseudanabaena biceps PCC 7429]MDG3495915.1 hypothetical protein [Pseudanabaena catenata USMAC16]